MKYVLPFLAGALVGAALVKVGSASPELPPFRLYFPEAVTSLEAVPIGDRDGDGFEDFWIRGISCPECLETHARHAAAKILEAGTDQSVGARAVPDGPRVR